jgi:predicted transposase/invertase (TIGR01784 family)
MAGSLLMSVSKDEREQAVYRSRRMYQTDMQSNIATAEDRGRKDGRQEGVLAVARNMIKRNRPIDEIIEDTGLTREEVEKLSI